MRQHKAQGHLTHWLHRLSEKLGRYTGANFRWTLHLSQIQQF